MRSDCPPATRWTRVILPPAIRTMIPPLVNLTISFFKASAILSVLQVSELMTVTNRSQQRHLQARRVVFDGNGGGLLHSRLHHEPRRRSSWSIRCGSSAGLTRMRFDVQQLVLNYGLIFEGPAPHRGHCLRDLSRFRHRARVSLLCLGKLREKGVVYLDLVSASSTSSAPSPRWC